jgi:hypothetical protein
MNDDGTARKMEMGNIQWEKLLLNLSSSLPVVPRL